MRPEGGQPYDKFFTYPEAVQAKLLADIDNDEAVLESHYAQASNPTAGRGKGRGGGRGRGRGGG